MEEQAFVPQNSTVKYEMLNFLLITKFFFMKVFTKKGCNLFCLPFIIVFVISVSVFAQGFSPAVQLRLQHIIDSFQNNSANPFVGGMAVAINVDGLAQWQGVTGYADRLVDAQNNLIVPPAGTPFALNMTSRIYSVTKMFTAALVLELAKENYFNLDSPVKKFLPMQAINPGLNPNVTIRQLLAHESGYSDYTDEYMLQISVAFQPTRVWNAFETISFCHQINTPGAERRYSSTNYIMLGAIVEVVTGIPMEQHYRQRFFNPLQLNSMYLSVREPENGHGAMVSPHDNISFFNPIFQLTGQPTFPDAYTNISRFPLTAIASLAFSGGGIVSNATDMAKWGNALFGGRATSNATLQTMLNSISATPDEDNDYLGYGLWTNKKISSTDYFVGHNGSALGYRSLLMYQPDRMMSIALVTNYYGCNPYEIERKLYEALPVFLCGNDNRKTDKIIVCFKGKELCVARPAAAVHIRNGAYLGTCSQQPTVINYQPMLNAVTENLPAAGGDFYVFPNPSSDNVTINFKALEDGNIKLELYSLDGKLVKLLFSANMQKGAYKRINLPTNGLSSGTYICRLQSNKGSQQQKLVVIK